jgi:hypothetical protein
MPRTLTRLAGLGTLSRIAGEGLIGTNSPLSPSPAPRERGTKPEGLGG